MTNILHKYHIHIICNRIRQDNQYIKDMGQRSFTYLAVNQWNDLPGSLRKETELKIYKTKVKKWISDNVSI